VQSQSTWSIDSRATRRKSATFTPAPRTFLSLSLARAPRSRALRGRERFVAPCDAPPATRKLAARSCVGVLDELQLRNDLRLSTGMPARSIRTTAMRMTTKVYGSAANDLRPRRSARAGGYREPVLTAVRRQSSPFLARARAWTRIDPLLRSIEVGRNSRRRPRGNDQRSDHRKSITASRTSTSASLSETGRKFRVQRDRATWSHNRILHPVTMCVTRRSIPRLALQGGTHVGRGPVSVLRQMLLLGQECRGSHHRRSPDGDLHARAHHRV